MLSLPHQTGRQHPGAKKGGYHATKPSNGSHHHPPRAGRRRRRRGCGLASEPALAQRCPATPPARTRGPNVWLDLDQHELDEAYDQSVYAFNQRYIQERRDERNELMAKVLGKPERVAYGPPEIEKVDIYKTKRPNAPTMIFLHGGAWRGGRSAQGAYHAEPFVKAGAHFINVEFNNVPETNGDLMPMVDQCRRAVAWVYRNAKSFGGDPNALYLSASRRAATSAAAWSSPNGRSRGCRAISSRARCSAAACTTSSRCGCRSARATSSSPTRWSRRCPPCAISTRCTRRWC